MTMAASARGCGPSLFRTCDRGAEIADTRLDELRKASCGWVRPRGRGLTVVESSGANWAAVVVKPLTTAPVLTRVQQTYDG